MQIARKESKSLFRVDVKDLNTRKVKGFMVYEEKLRKMNLIDFVDELKEKVEEI